MSITEQKNYAENAHRRLFDTLAEDLKLSYLTIARTTELAKLEGELTHLDTVASVAGSALELLDNYLLSMRLQRAGEDLLLEPVSLAASLSDIAHQLEAAAHQQRCDIELHIAGKYQPIMAHSAGLSAALLSLGHVFIAAQGQKQHTARPVIKLAAHRTRYGIVAGLFTDSEGLTTDMLRRARQLYGKSRSPMSQFAVNADAGVFVADSLLRNMSPGLRVARYQKLAGLAATFAPSQQLALV